MNKKNFSVALWATLFISLLATSCKEPTPKPIPKPEQPTDQTFKPLLSLDADGTLSAIPLPFIGFDKGRAEIEAWEALYGSTFSKEEKGTLLFKTNDPEGKQPLRSYTLKKGKHIRSTVILRKELVFTPSGDLTPKLLQLLENENYVQETVNNQADLLIYNNSTLLLTFAPLNEQMALILYDRSPGAPSGDFNPQWKDMPMLIAEKPFAQYTEQEIKAYEEKLGLREVNPSKSTSKEFAFKAKGTGTNLHEVIYDMDGTSGTPEAFIRCISKNVNFQAVKSEPFINYMRLNGFEYKREAGSGQAKMIIFQNKKLAVRLEIDNSRDSENQLNMIFLHDPSLVNPDEPEEDPDKRKAFYMPFIVWGDPISDSSPVIAQEKERNFTAKYRPGDDTQVPAIPAAIVVDFPYDKDYSNSVGTKAGMLGFEYLYDKFHNTDKYNKSQISKVSIFFNKAWVDQKKAYNDPALVKFLTEQGFAYKGQEAFPPEAGKGNFYFYYNAEKGILCSILSGNLFGTDLFSAEMRPEANYTPSMLRHITAEQIHTNMQQKR